ncbi:Uncharacterized protein ESCO_000099 [Escovopsis weberi]|uniref:Uncharacterized protein n=1 Tax=Escovopsis weberi TaxID=150374 RepID=A0A0N0RTB9_ESCWE|nr:Uncharacterized protein ESCO_000099 [Escovopsis weberi]
MAQHQHQHDPARTGIVIFSGGSATNSLVDVFEAVRSANNAALSYVIPISDNGGSSSEIIRVFGGPGIGDVRSRLTLAVKQLFEHRLPPDSYAAARAEWFEIVEGSHPLWAGVSSPKRELVRSFLNAFNHELLKRMRPSSRFDFSGASVGNLFLTGARLFTGSFEAAIYLLSQICGVPDRVAVLPALNTNFAHHIAAGLEDGSVIVGQNDISHPSIPSAAVPVPGSATSTSTSTSTGISTPVNGGERPPASITAAATAAAADDDDPVEDANLPGSHPALRRPALRFSKDQEDPLPSRIARIWYINPYGHEIRLPANPRVLAALHAAHTVVFSIGSLFTSIVPSLVLKGVGAAVASPLVQHKILILNASTDRETSCAPPSPSSSSSAAAAAAAAAAAFSTSTSSPPRQPFSALDFVAAVANACAQSSGLPDPPREEDYAHYVTHLVYLEGPGAPVVDRQRFARLGIDTTRLYGPRDGGGRGSRYDGKALAQRLESIIGHVRSERGRRNTFVG